MSAGSKKAKKELYGHPAVLGHDLIAVGVAAVSGLVGHTALAPVTNGLNRFVMPRAGIVDYVLAQASPALSAGSLNVAVHKNGVAAFSGSLTSSLSSHIENFFNPDNGNALTVASGDVVQAFYAISSALSPGVQAYALQVRVGLTYRDAQ